MKTFGYMQDNQGPRDISFGRLNVFADEDVPQSMIENISNVIELEGAPKKFSEYTEEEVKDFSRLFGNSEGIMTHMNVYAFCLLVEICTTLSWNKKNFSKNF